MTGTLFAQTAPSPATTTPVVEDRSTLDFNAGVPRHGAKLLYVNHSIGIENRTDPQAMSHLEAKLMAEDAANGVAVAKATAPVAPVSADLAARIKDAQVRLKAAKEESRLAVKAKDKTRVAQAKLNVRTIQAEIKSLRAQVAAEHKAAAGTKKARKSALKVQKTTRKVAVKKAVKAKVN
jgi:hypothetical protein